MTLTKEELVAVGRKVTDADDIADLPRDVQVKLVALADLDKEAVLRAEENRDRLPECRSGFTKKGKSGRHKYYVTVNFYPDDPLPPSENPAPLPEGMGETRLYAEGLYASLPIPAEVFVTISKAGSDVRGLIGAWATVVSLAWQSGVTWEKVKAKGIDQKFGSMDPNVKSILHDIVTDIDFVIELRRGMWCSDPT